MKNKTCAAFLFEGFIDHQVSLALACLNRGGTHVLETFSTRGQPVTSASGLRVTPHASLDYMQPEDFDVLLLPGGVRWEKGDNLDIFPLLTATAGRRPLIAIGEAILGLADLGLLDNIPHTGCRPGYIQRFCPEYTGAAFFRREPCVSARKIITIDGAALLPPGHGILGLFDTLQKIYANTHAFFDQEQQST
jgi:transcriptional regulator GlxA family with amidase domain